MLTTMETDFFKDQGYLMVPRMFDAPRVAALNTLVEHHMRQAVVQRAGGTNDLVDLNPDGTPKAVYRLSRIMDRDPAFKAVARDPRIAGVVRDLLGPDAALCINRHNMMVAKAPKVGRQIDWHQDGATWGHDELVALIVFLSDADTHNGCLEIIPGLHRHGVLKTSVEDGFARMDIAETELAALSQQALPVVARAGDALFFHALLPHFSKPNTSEHARPTLTFAYISEARKPLKFATSMAPIETCPLS